MVRIVEQVYHRLVCVKCKSLLEYTNSEVKMGEFNHDYLGDYDIENYILCPSCFNRCILRIPL